jgi:hypothetical protein
MKLISTATPGGNAVPSYIVPQTSLDGANLGRPRDGRSVPAGMRMMTTTRARKLKVEPALLNCASHLVGIEERTAWMIMMKTVKRKTW